LIASGLYFGLFDSPQDYQQGDAVRIMYVHVPSAWLASFLFLSLAVSCIFYLAWKHPLADIISNTIAPIGAMFSVLTLVTGSLWGKPMWGTWWVWDARLTSELILLFLYLAYISLNNAFDNPKTAAKASSILAIVGLVNLPIIHYSVKWWNTLHQGSMFNDMSNPSMHPDMLWPLLIMVFAFQFLYGVLALVNARDEVLVREQNSRWVRAVVTGEKL
jgi:heme exporter protein C